MSELPSRPAASTPAEPALPASRRTFLKGSAAALVGSGLAASLGPLPHVHAAGSDVIKVGLIGCGGRGGGAARDAADADSRVRLTAIADAFEDVAVGAQSRLARALGEQYAVDKDHVFFGLDAYQPLIDSGVDVVLCAAPPHFRPRHLRAAVQAGKHVFCEKPVAVDAPGVRSALESCQLAEQKGLSVVSGLCWRYDYGVRETMRRIFDGEIGDVVAIQENFLTSTLWHRGRRPEWSDLEYQIRNWLYFTWLSGDHIVEQHIHSLDKALWLMHDQPPARCYGLGGRQVRTDEKWGQIYDHFSVCYEWPNGVKTFAFTRQMENCHNDVEDYVMGTRGRARLIRHTIESEGKSWRYQTDNPVSMFKVEHQELFQAITSGTPINNGQYMSYSTLMAIMGREACYTGQQITWEQAMNSTQRLGPESYEWGELAVEPVAMPGVTSFT